jgi:hypothetical protein
MLVQGTATDAAHRMMGLCCQTLVVLLSVAGYKHEVITVFQGYGFVALFKSQVKTKCTRTPLLAWTAAKEAFCTESIDEYHDKLMSYRYDNWKNVVLPADHCLVDQVMDANAIKKNYEEEKKKAKESARECTVISGTKVFGACSKCSKSEENLLYCPCQTVRYCCKDCQMADFKFHKQYCSHLKQVKTSTKS